MNCNLTVTRSDRINAEYTGLTQEELGFEADLRRTYISILELGHQQPTLTTILKLAKPLKYSAQDIVGMVESELRQRARRKA
jgi:transcriptional regulator with XRE-family HTH domain